MLADRIMIAEPWDIGPGGYQLGNFGEPFLEWNDRYRDDVRRFWQGDGRAGDLATRLAGSFDIFGRDARTRSVNFIACHDGFTLADLTAYSHKHNEANRENNRDGHDENFSWNHGVEGPTGDPAITAARAARHQGDAGDAVRLARHDHAGRRRRVRALAKRQQQCLCAGQ